MTIDITNPAHLLLILLILAAWGAINMMASESETGASALLAGFGWLVVIAASLYCIIGLIVKAL